MADHIEDPPVVESSAQSKEEESQATQSKDIPEVVDVPTATENGS